MKKYGTVNGKKSKQVIHSFIHSIVLSFKHSLVLLIFATLKMSMELAQVKVRKDFCESDEVQGKHYWSISVMIPETIIEGHILAPVPFSFLKRIYSFIHSFTSLQMLL